MTQSSSDPALLGAVELVAMYRTKQLSPVEALRATLARIERFNPIVNAYLHLDADRAIAAAKASETRWHSNKPAGLVDGVPLGVKDNIAVNGMPSRFGSKLTPDTPQKIDSPAVARLREHGAVILGKTAMPEYGWKATSDSPLTGYTRNPWDTRMTTGGSSAGAVAAVVLGMGPMQLGTDGGGSIRIPAAFTGCYGIKPTRARVASFPTSPLGTVAHHGPLTRTVADAALMMSIIAAPDARDVYAWNSPAPDYGVTADDGVRGLRIAYSPRLNFGRRVEPEVEQAVAAAVKVFEELGAHVEHADPEIDASSVDCWNTMWWSAMALQLIPFKDRLAGNADPDLLRTTAHAAEIPAFELIRAQVQRADLHNAFVRFHAKYDLLLTPALPLPAFEVGDLMPRTGGWGDSWTDWAPFSYPFNLTQQPAASVPCGFTAEGLPIGLQVVGPVGADDRVLRASRAYETARPFRMCDEPNKTH